MKLIRLIAAILFVILLAAYCSKRSVGDAGSQLEQAAKAEITSRGLNVQRIRIAEGVREKAACGVASGRRFVYRDKSRHGGAMAGLVVERDQPPEVFDPFFAAWCPR